MLGTIIIIYTSYCAVCTKEKCNKCKIIFLTDFGLSFSVQSLYDKYKGTTQNPFLNFIMFIMYRLVFTPRIQLRISRIIINNKHSLN